MKLKKIEWKEGKYCFTYGYIAGIRMFTCAYIDGGQYKLSTILPLKSKLYKDREDCKKGADKMLEYFFNFIQEK